MTLIRFRKVDDSTRADHYHLTSEDHCLYLYEKTSGKDYSFSKANQLISNLKKKPSSSNVYELRHKNKAIAASAAALRHSLNEKWLDRATLVPIPGSKCEGHADYDNRMERVCSQIRAGVDVRSLVKQRESTNASHECEDGQRVTLDELLAQYEVQEGLCTPAPLQIGIFDDVLTAGTHYRAMHTVLSQRFPSVPIVGIFISRRIFPDDDIFNFFANPPNTT